MTITRLEIIDHTAEARYSAPDARRRVIVPPDGTAEIEVSEQDDGRTLKVFIKDANQANASRTCSRCSALMTRFANEDLPVEHRGLAATVSALSGWRCACGEVEFDIGDGARYAAAGDVLVQQWIETNDPDRAAP